MPMQMPEESKQIVSILLPQPQSLTGQVLSNKDVQSLQKCRAEWRSVVQGGDFAGRLARAAVMIPQQGLASHGR